MNRRVALAAAFAVVAGAMFVGGMYVARASPGGETRKFLSFSGRITGRTGPQMMTFTFRHGAATVCAPTVMALPDAAGNFAVEIPIATCAADLFDGSDVTVEVSVGATVLSAARPINPVPYALYAERVGVPECPLGYARATEAGLPAQALLCRKGADDMMRVGSGAQTFWIDRYPNSLWANPAGTGSPIAPGVATTVAANGTYTTPTYALSKVGVPSAYGFTWFQAQAYCRASGKRLPTIAEALLAAQGTPGYLVALPTRPDECPGARVYDYDTGSTPACISAWGVEQLMWYRHTLTSDLEPKEVRQSTTIGSAVFSSPQALLFQARHPVFVDRITLFNLSASDNPTTVRQFDNEVGFRCAIGP